MRRLIAITALSLVACATSKSGALHAAVPVADPPIARVGDRLIRQSEVDKRAGDDFFKLMDQLYELRTDTAERIAVEILVEAEARKERVDPDVWIEQRLETGLREPTEGELQELFARVKKNLPEEATFAEVKPQLRRALKVKGEEEQTCKPQVWLRGDMRLRMDLSPGEGGPARAEEPGDGRVCRVGAHVGRPAGATTTTRLWGYASSTS